MEMGKMKSVMFL